MATTSPGDRDGLPTRLELTTFLQDHSSGQAHRRRHVGWWRPMSRPTTTQRISLQIALDRIPLDRAEQITAAVRDHADWIEVGTSLVKRYGMPGVARIVAAAGGMPVLADLKTADDARTELTMAADAGARSVTVLGLAAPAHPRRCACGRRRPRLELMVDLMELDAGRAGRVGRRRPGTAVLAAHVPKDAQTRDHRSCGASRRLGRRAAAGAGRRPRRP